MAGKAEGKVEYLTPDGHFLQELLRLGGGSLKKCFQCGTCSVVCSLSPHRAPFPRKEMMWAQWGLKDRLLKDPDIWLCYGCDDCSTSCPRGAKPGDVLAALRNYSIMSFALPPFLARVFSQPRFLPLLFGLPAILLLAFLWSTGRWAFPEGEIVFSHFIPIPYVEIAGLTVVGLALLVAAIGLGRFWKNIREFPTSPVSGPASPPGAGASATSAKQGFLTSFISSLVGILKHSNFRQCQESKGRYYAHLALFYGFILLTLATLGRTLYYYGWGREAAPPLADPVKIAGNAGGLLLLAGCTWVIYHRFSKRGEAGKATYYDWFFIGVLFLVTLTGLLTQGARYAQMAPAAYTLYLIHLGLVFTLFAYAPFSKLAHLLYRTLSMTYARQIDRSR